MGDFKKTAEILPQMEWQPKSHSEKLIFRLAMNWKRIAGRDLFQHSAPVKYDNGHLTLGIKDPTLLFECQSNHAVWIKKINTFLNSQKIKKIDFKLIQ